MPLRQTSSMPLIAAAVAAALLGALPPMWAAAAEAARESGKQEDVVESSDIEPTLIKLACAYEQATQLAKN